MDNQDNKVNRRALLGGVAVAGLAVAAGNEAQAQEAPRAASLGVTDTGDTEYGHGEHAMAAYPQTFPPLTPEEHAKALQRPSVPAPNPPFPKPAPTDEAGLVAGDVKVPTFDREMYAYRAYPKGKKKPSLIVLLPSNGGVTAGVKDLVRRMAKAGYYCIAADYISPYPQLGKVPRSFVLIYQTNEALTQLDTDAQIAFAAKEGAAVHKLGLMGFSWGARQTWKYTARNPKVLAGCPFYGPLSAPGYSYDLSTFNPNVRETQPSPIQMAAGVKGRILGFYGLDPRIPNKEEIEPMRAALAAAGDSKSQIVQYADSDHGFFEPTSATYNPKNAKDAWDKMMHWFKSHGVT